MTDVWHDSAALGPDERENAQAAHVERRQALCDRAAEALWRSGGGWVPEMAPLTLAERAIVTSYVRKMREGAE